MGSSNQEQIERKRSINTEGSTYIEGNIHTQGGDFVARDKITIHLAAAAGVVSLHQLPPPPADFTGREEELAELAEAIVQGGVTISGLRGMGGVGKTALALKLAQQLAPQYPDAQFYLDLRGTSDNPLTPAQAMAHVVRAYHPTTRLPDTDAELSALYRSVLHDQRTLLLMDNGASREQVAPLLCPGHCVLLVTSRRWFTLPGIKALNLDTLPPEDAEALLKTIAPRIDGHAAEMAELCGYLPLALRLAGSVLAERESLSTADYLRRLADTQTRLDLVDASLNVSYDLLDGCLQRLWCTLSVFPGTFNHAAAAAVWQMEQDPAQDALDELVRYSLLEWNRDTKRYRLHDLTRIYATEELKKCKELRLEAQWRHSEHYANVLEGTSALYERDIESTEQNLALATFDIEWNNIEAGQLWAADPAQDIEAVDLSQEKKAADRLCTVYATRGAFGVNLRQHPSAQLRWWQAGLESASRRHDRQAEGRLLFLQGHTYRHMGKVEKAHEVSVAALKIARDMGDLRTEGRILGELGNTFRMLGEMQSAIEYQELAHSIADQLGDRRGQGKRLRNLGHVYSDLGETSRAVGCYRAALEICRSVGDRDTEGSVLDSLGSVYFDIGDVRIAIEYHRQALAIHQEIGDRRGEAADLAHLGNIYCDLGDVQQAIAYQEKALAINEDTGDLRGKVRALNNLGRAYCTPQTMERATEYFRSALAISCEIGDRRGEGLSLGNLGLACADLGQADRAIQFLEQALAIHQETGYSSGKRNHSWNLGLLYEATDPARAVELMSVRVAYEREIGHPDAEVHAERVAQVRARLET